MNQTDLEKLPFSKQKQLAVIGHNLVNRIFFFQCVNTIQPKWFLEERPQKLWAAIVEFYKRHRRQPSKEEILEGREIRLEEVKEQNKYDLLLTEAIRETERYGLDAIVPDLTEWMHTRVYHTAVMESADLFNRGKFSDAFKSVHNASGQIRDIRFDQTEEVDFSDYQNQFTQDNLDHDDACTFGIKTLDQCLTPYAKNGSLLPGDTTVLLAPSNVGKTTTLLNVIRANIKRGKRVLFLTHEGRPEDIRNKLWCLMLSVVEKEENQSRFITMPDLLKNWTNPAFQKEMEMMAKFISKYLTYIPMNKAGLTVEDVATVVQRKQEESLAKFGVGYSLLVDDYPAKLLTEQSGGNWARRHIDALTYNYFVQMALQHKMHSLVVVQTNREGSKVNKGVGSDRLLEMEDVAESWDVMTQATSVISLNRTPDDKNQHRMKFHICKSRSSEVGITVVSRSRFSSYITHHDNLESFYYLGNSHMDDLIERFFRDYREQRVPELLLK